MGTDENVRPSLTRAAKRDLLALAHGEDIVPCYGPWEQLRDNGLATGTQHHLILTERGRVLAENI